MKSDRPTDASLHDDAGVAAMLTEAFDAPPVPRSLTKRLEDGIVAQWGRSPELIPAREGAVHVAKSAASRGVAILRSWPVAAGLAASVALVFFFFSGGNNSVWASMIEAIKHRGIIQVGDDSQARWLDLRRQAIGSQTSEHVKLIDVGNQRVMLRRPTDSETLYQAELNEAPSVDNNSLVAAFLMGEPLSARSLTSLRDLSVVNESLHWRQMEGRQVAELRVRLQGADREPFSVRVAIDADTHLPIGLQAQAGTQPTKLEFLDSAGESPSQRFFPNELKVVDLALEEPNEPIELVADRAIAALASETSQLAATEDTPREQQSTRTSTLPEGAANEWLPVARVSRTGEEVVDRINDLVEKLWQRENVQPVGAASDLQLLRRAYLDLAGRAPTVAEVRNYIKADAKDRYELLVDRLLESPDHASALAAVWRSFLIPEGVDLDAFGGREAFDQWLAERFEADEPYDELVRKLLLAEGRVTQSGPLLFYTALKLDADQLAARTSRAFLGMRLECAQCHDHPFEPWSQEDFWSYAAFFARISRPKGELESVSTVMRVHDIDRGEVMLPETETVVAPRFLGGNVSLQDSDVERSEGNERTDRRAQLAQWLTGAGNPYFARATVNRLWSHCFGRGIVDPVDDFGSNNEPVSPELFDTLASQLIESRFNLKQVIRSIVLSDAYRLSSSSLDGDEPDGVASKRLEFFGQMNVKTLTAEQLYDCVAIATLQANSTSQAVARFANPDRRRFLQQFASPNANRTEYLAGIPQALLLMNGTFTSGATGEGSSGLVRSLKAPFFTDRQRLDVLYMAILSRPATNDEFKTFAEFVPSDASPEQRMSGLADLLWALVNSSEFALNH